VWFVFMTVFLARSLDSSGPSSVIFLDDPSGTLPAIANSDVSSSPELSALSAPRPVSRLVTTA